MLVRDKPEPEVCSMDSLVLSEVIGPRGFADDFLYDEIEEESQKRSDFEVSVLEFSSNLS